MYDIDKIIVDFNSQVQTILTLNCSNLSESQIQAITKYISDLHVNTIDTIQQWMFEKLKAINDTLA